MDAISAARAAIERATLDRAVVSAELNAARGVSTARMTPGDRITHAGTIERLEQRRRGAQAAQSRAGHQLAAAEYEEARSELQLKWQITPVPESGAGEHNARSAFGYSCDPLDVALADGDGERLVTLHLAGRGQKPPAGSTYLDHLRAS